MQNETLYNQKYSLNNDKKKLLFPGSYFGSTIVLLFLIFIFLFPKGGFKVGNIPITFGYIIASLSALFSVFFFISHPQEKMNISYFFVFLLMTPFQILIIIQYLFYGVQSVGFFISTLTTFIFLPVFFFLIYGNLLNRLNLTAVLNTVRIFVFWVAVFGIIGFIYFQITGKYIQIPYLTVNIDDVGDLFLKNNSRNGVSKLISTFNNGNIYGACILMLLPLYNYLEKSGIKKIIVIVSLILTLSRTTWIGLFFYFFLDCFYINKKNTKEFLKYLSFLFFIGVGIFFALNLIGASQSFLFDSSLGGRSSYLQIINSSNIFSSQPIGGILEIIYLGVLNNYGWLGLLFFTLLISSSILIFFVLKRGKISKFKKTILSGLFIYMLIACSDGAILYIPVMFYFYFLSILLFYKNNNYSNGINL